MNKQMVRLSLFIYCVVNTLSLIATSKDLREWSIPLKDTTSLPHSTPAITTRSPQGEIFCADQKTPGLFPPDVHVCGSEPSPNCPNGPKVRLSYTASGDRSPQQLATFFIDERGQGYFRDFENLRRESLEEIWKEADRNGNDTFLFWGQFASEKVEASRKLYFIDVKFRGGKWAAYRIRGPQVTGSKWITLKHKGEST